MIKVVTEFKIGEISMSILLLAVVVPFVIIVAP